MNVAYVEMIGGAAGNMLLGAFVDAGVEFARLEAQLRTIPLDAWTLERKRVVKCGIAAEYIDFIVAGEDCRAELSARRLDEVVAIVEHSGLSEAQKTRARAIYVRLAEAEAKAHGTSVDRIHFHEVGATDAILDVAASCIALELFEVKEVTCSPFPVGRGTVRMLHGTYPNPPPATAELLRGAPAYDGGMDGEMVTTTAAAILTTLVAQPGLRPPMRAKRIGYGAGRSDFAIPNVTRDLDRPSASRHPREDDRRHRMTPYFSQTTARSSATKSACSKRISTTCRLSASNWRSNARSQPARTTSGWRR